MDNNFSGAKRPPRTAHSILYQDVWHFEGRRLK